MRGKAFNPQVFLEFVCYTTFAVVLFHLVKSDKYLSYVTPKMEPYLYFTMTVMMIWSVYGLRRLFRPQHKIRAAHCLVLAIPILLFVLPHNSISTSNLSAGYVGGNGLSISPSENTFDFTTDNVDTSDNIEEATPGESEPSDDVDLDTSQSEIDGELIYPTDPELKIEDNKIIVEDEDYYSWLTELYNNMEHYDGYQIVIKGFVFKDSDTMEENEFVPARLMMSCCVADLTPCGLICKYEKATELELDTWITVEGIIHIGQYMGSDEPQITVTKISPAEKPVEEYIYP